METLLVKISEPLKTNYVIGMIKSMDFVASVDKLTNYASAKEIFDSANQIAEKTELSKLSDDEIIFEIKNYRSEKQSHSH